MAIGEVIQQRKDLGGASCADQSLRAQEIRVVTQSIADPSCPLVSIDRIGVAVVECVGMPQRQVGSGGADSRMSRGIARNS